MKIGYKGKRGPVWLRRLVIKLEFGWEFIGWGVFKDRRFPMIRIFPFPILFTRITLGKINGPYSEGDQK